MAFSKIQKSTVSQIIVEQIQEKLLKGELKAGQKLPPERQLAEMLGVSRSSLREAMRALQYMGILEIRQDGAHLCENLSLLSDHFKLTYLLKQFSVMELIEARKLVEAEIVRLAAERATAEDKETIAEAFEETLRYQETGEEKDFLMTDFAFHRAIAEAAQNSVLVEMLNAIRDLLLEVNLDVIKRPNQVQVATAFHEKIMKAILSGNAREASGVMLDHLTNVEEAIAEVYKAELSEDVKI